VAKKKKLSESEVERAIQKVRGLYNDYIIRYEKSPSIKEDFEFRLGQQRRIDGDMAVFLHAEVSVVKELEARETRKRSVASGPPNKGKKGPDFADKIMEQHREQIKKYPDIDLPEGSVYEMRKLFGMFQLFDRTCWPLVLKVFRQLKAVIGYGIRTALENTEGEFCIVRRETWPPAVDHYCVLLTAVSPDWGAIEREQQHCIREAAFFLHRILRVCETGLKLGELDEETAAGVENVLKFLHSVITDFRLHDLKPNNLKELLKWE